MVSVRRMVMGVDLMILLAQKEIEAVPHHAHAETKLAKKAFRPGQRCGNRLYVEKAKCYGLIDRPTDRQT